MGLMILKANGYTEMRLLTSLQIDLVALFIFWGSIGYLLQSLELCIGYIHSIDMYTELPTPFLQFTSKK